MIYPAIAMTRDGLLPVRGAAVAFALVLLGTTLAWHVPMMLWDHLDLVPILDAARGGALSGPGMLEVHHGSHLHVAAYALLRVTNALSGGRTWLDSVTSWGLLVVYAALVWRMARASLPDSTSMRWWLALMFLALYPGHLANLQWGWQVAVFICLAASAASLHLLTRERLAPIDSLAALVLAIVAILSFSVGLALLPVAVALILLRQDRPRRARLIMALPWCVSALAVAASLGNRLGGGENDWPSTAAALAYLLNFLGSGVARCVTGAAPWVAAAALLSAAVFGWRLRRERAALPWIGWILFALVAGSLIVLGRAGAFGPDHAFVARYVSFSSTFWLGWLGLSCVARKAVPAIDTRPHALLAVVVLALAALNAIHLGKNARELGLRANATAAHIRAAWPHVDERVLREIYFERADVARHRLDRLHDWGAAPFDARDEARLP